MSAQREAFERAFPRLDKEKWSDGRYRSIASCDAWTVWQAAQAAMTADPEIAELRALNEKLAGILTRTANALRGEPAPLALHSWHDLPERVTAVLALLRALTTIAAPVIDAEISRTGSAA